MKWTKAHSKNAVAARARKSMVVVEPLPESKRRVPVPRRARARFTIQIRDHVNGDSITLNLHASPWANRWICDHGEFSSTKLGRAVGLILQGGGA